MYKHMAQLEAVVRRWGNSFGILLPREVIKSEGLKENARVSVILVRRSDALKRAFGSLAKKTKLTGQQVKDVSRVELYGD